MDILIYGISKIPSQTKSELTPKMDGSQEIIYTNRTLNYALRLLKNIKKKKNNKIVFHS